VLELAHLFDNDDDVLARTSTGKCEAYKVAILKAVEDEQAVFGLFEAKSGIKLSLRRGFEAEVVTGAPTEIFLDDRAILVYLHRINTKMVALILKFLYRFLECSLQLADLPKKQLREAKQDGCIDPSFA